MWPSQQLRQLPSSSNLHPPPVATNGGHLLHRRAQIRLLSAFSHFFLKAEMKYGFALRLGRWGKGWIYQLQQRRGNNLQDLERWPTASSLTSAKQQQWMHPPFKSATECTRAKMLRPPDKETVPQCLSPKTFDLPLIRRRDFRTLCLWLSQIGSFYFRLSLPHP